jgi:hypothetical protein
MFVIRLPNGNLMAPESAFDHQGHVVGDAYVEVSPADPEYARLATQAISEEEVDRQRRRWREDDAALRREFEDYLASQQHGAGEPG